MKFIKATPRMIDPMMIDALLKRALMFLKPIRRTSDKGNLILPVLSLWSSLGIRFSPIGVGVSCDLLINVRLHVISAFSWPCTEESAYG